MRFPFFTRNRKHSPSKPHYARLSVQDLESRDVPSATLDLTSRGSTGEANGAIFTQYDARPTGTGHIDSFVRLQGSGPGGTQEGFNTDARPLAYQENKSPQFTRSLRVSDLPTVNIGGVVYREFLLDINQKASQPLLSLDQIKIFVGQSGNLSGRLIDGKLAGLEPVYDLDAGGDKWIKLDYRLNSGSGAGDMLMYIPDSVFQGGEFVYLYSKFGENIAGNAGFEEWAAGQGSPVTPQLGTISGTVRNDRTGAPLGAGFMVYIDANKNGQFDSDEAFTYTNSLGQYEFSNLIGDESYTLGVEIAETHQQVWDGWYQTRDEFLTVYLEPGEDEKDVDFFYISEWLPE